MDGPQGRLIALPSSYGTPARILPWSYVDERMTQSQHYWVATTTAGGAPYVRPIDGIWLDRTLYFGSDPQARWRRNIERDPRIEVHLENADAAVIMRGVAQPYKPDRALAERLTAASNAKYEWQQTVDDVAASEGFMFRPQMVVAWTLLYEDATRWDL
jgi:hypothetical protein